MHQTLKYVLCKNSGCIWFLSNKKRQPFLTKEIRTKLHLHIIENCKEKNIFLQAINGFTDHLHCLISLGKEQSIAKVAQLIKENLLYG